MSSIATKIIQIILLAAILLGAGFLVAQAQQISAPTPAGDPGEQPPQFLDVSGTKQSKAGWLTIGSSNAPGSPLDVFGDAVMDNLLVDNNAIVESNMLVGSTNPLTGASLDVDGLTGVSNLTGSGERNVCADGSGVLTICGATSTTPATECSDGVDNDGDGKIDAQDTGCWADVSDNMTYDPTDDSEGNTACNDGIDNDNNGFVDADDKACWTDPLDSSTYDPTIDSEDAPACSDQLDNDNDGDIDENDNGCLQDPTDPSSAYDPSKQSEDDPITQAVTVDTAPELVWCNSSEVGGIHVELNCNGTQSSSNGQSSWAKDSNNNVVTAYQKQVFYPITNFDPSYNSSNSPGWINRGVIKQRSNGPTYEDFDPTTDEPERLAEVQPRLCPSQQNTGTGPCPLQQNINTSGSFYPDFGTTHTPIVRWRGVELDQNNNITKTGPWSKAHSFMDLKKDINSENAAPRNLSVSKDNMTGTYNLNWDISKFDNPNAPFFNQIEIQICPDDVCPITSDYSSNNNDLPAAVIGKFTTNNQSYSISHNQQVGELDQSSQYDATYDPGAFASIYDQHDNDQNSGQVSFRIRFVAHPVYGRYHGGSTANGGLVYKTPWSNKSNLVDAGGGMIIDDDISGVATNTTFSPGSTDDESGYQPPNTSG